jgi:hypothetical protein
MRLAAWLLLSLKLASGIVAGSCKGPAADCHPPSECAPNLFGCVVRCRRLGGSQYQSERQRRDDDVSIGRSRVHLVQSASVQRVNIGTVLTFAELTPSFFARCTSELWRLGSAKRLQRAI